MATVNKGQRQRSSKKRNSWWRFKRRLKRFLEFHAAKLGRAVGKFLRFFRFFGKSAVWVIVIGIVIILTTVTESGWMELTDVLLRNVTFLGVIRDILFVILGFAMGRSLSRKKRKHHTRTRDKLPEERVQKPIQPETLEITSLKATKPTAEQPKQE